MVFEGGQTRLRTWGTVLLALSMTGVVVLAVAVTPVGGASDDGVDVTDDTRQIGSDERAATVQDSVAPTISDFAVSNPSGRHVRVRFDSDEQLETIAVSISGAESTTLTRADFTESNADGTYTYTATYVANSDGDYTATLQTAADTDGNDGASGQTGTATVDTRVPQISKYTVSNPTGQTIDVSFDSNEQLESIEVSISGAESATLTMVNFTEADNGDTYGYTATYVGSSDGVYEAELETAADDADNNGAFSQRETVTVDTTAPTISEFSISNPTAQNIRVTFDADERLDTIGVSIDGTESASLFRSDFVGAETDDGYTYAATYGVVYDGNYTATLETAADSDGNDGASGQNATVIVDTTPPTISNYSVSNPSGRNVSVTFEADERLDSINVSVDGPVSATFQRNTINETADGTIYTYTGTFTVSADGNYSVSLVTAADYSGNDGASGQTGAVSVRTPDRTPPTAVAGANRTVGIGTQVSFDARNSTDDVGIASYEWDLDGDGTVDETRSTTTRVFEDPGTYTAALTVTDAAGNEDTDSVTITVRDMTAPTAATGSNRTVESGANVTLDARNSTDNVGIASYEWDLDGDGNADVTGPTATHRFEQTDTFAVTLTVTDEAGNTDSATLTITVDQSTPTPTTPTTAATPAPTDSTTSGSATSTTLTDTTPSGSGDGDGFTVLLATIAVLTTAMLGTRRR